MSSSTEEQQQQQQQERKRKEGEEKVELPLESSPYVKYSDLNEYKMQAYGTQGHLEPVDNSRQAGATDAPTLSGSGLSANLVKATEVMNPHGAV